MIAPDQLESFLDDGLDPAARAATEAALPQEPESLRWLVEQQEVDRLLRSVLAAPLRKQRLRESILAATAGCSTSQLRAQVLADTAVPAQDRTLHTALPGPRSWFGAGLETLRAAWSSSIRLRFGATGAAVAAVLCIAAWFALRPSPPPFGAPIGTLAEVVGNPLLDTPGPQAATAARRGTVVRVGDRLQTGDADKAEVRFNEGTVLRLGFNTTVEFPAATPGSTNAGSALLRPAAIQLLAGQVWSRVQPVTNATPYMVRTDPALAIARGTEFGVKLQRGAASTNRLGGPANPWVAVLTVKEGVVDFTNALGSVRATAMTESTASSDTAPTEPRRLQTIQTVQVSETASWSLMTAALDWPEAAGKLAGGGGTLGWQLRDVPAGEGETGAKAVRVIRSPGASAAARAGVVVGDMLVAVDGRPVTDATQVQHTVLARPETTLTIRLRRTEVERDVELLIPRGVSLMRGPELEEESAGRLATLFSRWTTPATPAGVAAQMELQRVEEASGIARSSDLQAAAFNNLGVAFELGEAFGPAVRAYGRAVELDPNVPLYRFNLGLALRKIGSFERAEEEFLAAVTLEPGSVTGRLRLAEIRSLIGQVADALALTEALLTAAPDEHGAWELQAQLLLKLQRPADAVAPARRAAELDPACPVARDYLGQAYQASGQWTEAEQSYREAIDRAPFEAGLHVNLGTLQRDRGEMPEAQRAFERALELQPDLALAWFNLGDLLLAQHEFQAAERALSRAAELDPDDAGTRDALGQVAMAQGQFQAAARWLREALRMNPDSPDSLGRLGQVAAELGDLAEAERLLRRSVELAPGRPSLNNNLGELLRRRGRLDEAEAFYRKALELDPNNPAAYGNLGILQAERKQFAEAEQTFRTLLSRSSGMARLPALANLATVCGKQGKVAEAELLFRQALELAPSHPGIGSGFAVFLADHRLRLDEALTLATHAVQTSPEDPQCLDALGWGQAQRGDFESAERILRRALELAGENPPADEIREHLRQVQEDRVSPDR